MGVSTTQALPTVTLYGGHIVWTVHTTAWLEVSLPLHARLRRPGPAAVSQAGGGADTAVIVATAPACWAQVQLETAAAGLPSPQEQERLRKMKEVIVSGLHYYSETIDVTRYACYVLPPPPLLQETNQGGDTRRVSLPIPRSAVAHSAGRFHRRMP